MSWEPEVIIGECRPWPDAMHAVCGRTGERVRYVPERTCEDAGTRFNAWVCSECKATLLLLFDDYDEPTYSVDGVADVPRFCPNCGAKVEGADE